MTNFTKEERYAVIVTMVGKLRSKGSWCGETHLQKSIFALNTLSKEKLPYNFIIYKHGPFSFDLREELVELKASGLVNFEFTKEGYGPSHVATKSSETLVKNSSVRIKKFSKIMDFVVDWFGPKDVRDLEKISTALFVDVKNKERSSAERAIEICSLKPHISLREAEKAVDAVSTILHSAQRIEFVDESILRN